MRRFRPGLPGTFMCLFLIMGCASLEADIPPSECPSPAVVIQTAVGHKVRLALEAGLATGCKWRLVRALDEKVLRLESIRWRPPPGSGRLEAGGREVWSFLATGAGQAEIVLEYLRAGEEKKAQLRCRRFRIQVRQVEKEVVP